MPQKLVKGDGAPRGISSPKFCCHFTCRLGEAVAAAKGNIRVICRIRPPPAEAGAGVIVSSAAETSSVSFPLDPSAVVLSLGGGSSKIFHFDAVLKDNCHQEACYDEARAAGTLLAILAHKTNMTF